mgnify:CR=1 FL=1
MKKSICYLLLIVCVIMGNRISAQELNCGMTDLLKCGKKLFLWVIPGWELWFMVFRNAKNFN